MNFRTLKTQKTTTIRLQNLIQTETLPMKCIVTQKALGLA